MSESTKASTLGGTGSNPAPRSKPYSHADIAQLARASPCHGEGCEFEPHYPLHNFSIPGLQTWDFLNINFWTALEMIFFLFSYNFRMFIPPGEKIIEKRKCRISGQDFVITEKESELYDQLSPVIGGIKCSLPYPTLCPNERQIRRMMWRNYDHFYK